MTTQIHLQPSQQIIGQLINSSKSLPPSPICRDNHYYYSKSQHNSPRILSQIQQAREILNSIEQQYFINNKPNSELNNSTINELKDVQNSIIEINNNVINSNVNNFINQDNNSATINRNVSPLIISEVSGNIIKNQLHTIEMDTLAVATNNEATHDATVTVEIIESEEEETEISEAQRLRDERIQEIRLSIQNETLLKNFTRWNIAYGLLGFLTVVSTVCMFIMGFVNTKDNIIYAGIGLSTLGFIIINHSIHIAYRKSRRNIENFQEEFIRIHESSNESNIDPTTVPSKLQNLTIGILASPVLEKPTPKLEPKNNNNPFNIFSPTTTR